MFIILSSSQRRRSLFIVCFKAHRDPDRPFLARCTSECGLLQNGGRCVDAWISRHTPVPGERDFPTISIVRVISCATYLHACARDLSIYLLTTGVILRRRAAIKPRRAEFTVTGSNSFVLSLPSFFLPLPFFYHLSRSRSRSFLARVLPSFMVRVMGSRTGWIP